MNKLGTGKDFPDTEPYTMVPHGDEAAFGDTEPMPLASTPSAARIPDTLGLQLAPAGGSEEDLMLEVRKDGRVCPQPTRWLEFYRVLQDHARGAALPAPPLTGSAWAGNSPASKRIAFHAQIAWCGDKGCIAPAHAFLSGLGKSDWYYGE